MLYSILYILIQKIEKSFKEINVKYKETNNLKVNVQETDTTSDIILNLINILNLTGKFNDYSLNYRSDNNNEIGRINKNIITNINDIKI